ncbi:MAG: RHS repeat-associated core domain-containing protein, partial [Acidimicrobiia bacterium]
VYLRARYYDPATGQFLTRDPIEAATREPYGYVGGNPLNATDPSGLIWKKFAVWIDDVANNFGIDAVMLAAVIEREGGDRASCGVICRRLESHGLAGKTIGVGQMRVDLANCLVETHWGVKESLGDTRKRLANNDEDAIALAGAYLHDLQEEYGLTSRQAAIAYAFGESSIGELQRTNWSGPQASRLGRGYDRRYRSISATGLVG